MVAFVQHTLGIDLPKALVNAPITHTAQGAWQSTGSIINLPAVIITGLVTIVLVRGVRGSARVNSIIVCVKVAAVLLFLAFVSPYVRTENWQPFIPPNTGAFGQFGWSGIFQGATMVFFAYIGFDAVSTAAQETRNPQRDLPIGILVSLSLCTVLYIAVSFVLTGAVSYRELSVPHPISVGIAVTGVRWLSIAVEVGAIAGLSSVMLVMLMGQPRIFFSMANDGLFPQFARKIHPRFGTPYVTTIIGGVACALAGGLLPIEVLGELTAIGTLFAFVLVCLGVMILRLRRPDLPRAFRVPGGPFVVPVLGTLSSAALILSATAATLGRLAIWLVLGFVVYFAYGFRHSRLRGKP